MRNGELLKVKHPAAKKNINFDIFLFHEKTGKDIICLNGKFGSFLFHMIYEVRQSFDIT